MSAAAALAAARAAGIGLRVEGNGLVLEAAAAPATALLDHLALHKAEILALLRSEGDNWSGEDWRAWFEERAAVAEFEGGLSRAEAEVRAFSCCVARWLDSTTPRSDPDVCLACGAPESRRDPLLPYGSGPAWLHARCWPGWYAMQEERAVAALQAMGIGPNRHARDTVCRQPPPDVTARRQEESDNS